MKIVECPDVTQINEAIKVLTQRNLHYYELLYNEKLTNANTRRPFYVTTMESKWAPYAGVTIGFAANADYNFNVFGNVPSDEEILKRCDLILEAHAANKQKDSLYPHYACCPLAVRTNCVCIASFSCPIHGHHCHGTHN
jgi:hypothetical protein